MHTVTPFDMTGGAAVAPEIPKQITPDSTEAPSTPPKPEPISPQLAALARRERALRQQARQMQADKQAFQTKQSEIENSVNTQWKQKLAQNPWDTMIEAGLTPEQATEIILNKPSQQDLNMQALQREIQALKKSQEESVDLVNKERQSQYDQAKKHMTMEAKLLVDSDSSFEAIKAMNATESVPALIEDVFHNGMPGKFQKGYVMSIEEAAHMVNEYLIDEVVKAAQLGPIQKRLMPQPAQKPFTQTEKPQTLSNRMTVSQPNNRSERERRERAILAAQGLLKN